MTALLDTHAFLWWILDSERLSDPARAALRDPSAIVLLSAASAWEIVIKAGLGKLRLPGDAEGFVLSQLDQNAITPLAIEFRHVLRVHHLPAHHRDPFDRILVAQSQVEGLPIITADPLIAQYGVPIIW